MSDVINKVTGISEGHTRKEVVMKNNKLLLLFISMFFILLLGQNVHADTRRRGHHLDEEDRNSRN